MAVSDPFWTVDVKILYQKDRLTSFVPNKKMTLSEQLNALVRFGAYAGLLLFAYNKSMTFLYLPIVMLVVTKLIYDSQNKSAQEPMYSNLSPYAKMSSPVDDVINPRIVKDGKQCVAPTDDNPFMNVSLADYRADSNRPAACPIDDPEIKESATAKFYDNLFRDVNDVFGRTNSARQFYTMPSTTIPNAQDEFMKFCYGDMMKPGCKQGNLQKCIAEDPRYNRRPPELDVTNQRYL